MRKFLEIFVLKIVWRKTIASLHRLTQAVQRANLRRMAGDPTWVFNYRTRPEVPVKNAGNLRARFENMAKQNEEEAKRKAEEERKKREEKGKVFAVQYFTTEVSLQISLKRTEEYSSNNYAKN